MAVRYFSSLYIFGSKSNTLSIFSAILLRNEVGNISEQNEVISVIVKHRFYILYPLPVCGGPPTFWPGEGVLKKNLLVFKYKFGAPLKSVGNH